MLRRLDGISASIRFRFDGRDLTADAGDTLAAALLANGVTVLRSTAVHAAPRGPFCMIGQCFDCLVQVDGVPNRQACQIIVADGMVVATQNGARLQP